MALFRSVLFAAFLAVFTPPYAFICLMTFPLPPQARYRIVTGWATVTMWVIKHVLGIRFRVEGAENMPAEAAVILSKHQSAWETIGFQRIFPPICFVLKRELLRVPFFGWGLAQMPHIAIDRKAGKDALTQVVEQGKVKLEEGFCVVVFPEGTRVGPGESRRYKPGGAWLAKRTGVLAVPVAHNAGEFWRRNAFVKYPGEIVVSIGPAIETAELEAAEINARAEQWIEGEMQRLFPHHYRTAATQADD